MTRVLFQNNTLKKKKCQSNTFFRIMPKLVLKTVVGNYCFNFKLKTVVNNYGFNLKTFKTVVNIVLKGIRCKGFLEPLGARHGLL